MCPGSSRGGHLQRRQATRPGLRLRQTQGARIAYPTKTDNDGGGALRRANRGRCGFFRGGRRSGRPGRAGHGWAGHHQHAGRRDHHGQQVRPGPGHRIGPVPVHVLGGRLRVQHRPRQPAAGLHRAEHRAGRHALHHRLAAAAGHGLTRRQGRRAAQGPGHGDPQRRQAGDLLRQAPVQVHYGHGRRPEERSGCRRLRRHLVPGPHVRPPRTRHPDSADRDLPERHRPVLAHRGRRPDRLRADR
jgi:hypothetical protein